MRKITLLILSASIFLSYSYIAPLKIWVNQIGFNPGAPKIARVIDLYDHTGGSGTFDILNENLDIVYSGALQYAGKVWGYYIWKADFSDFNKEGKYVLRASLGGQTNESDSFSISQDCIFQNTADLSSKFFSVQRCGVSIPGWHKPCHLDDGQLDDGTRVEVTGGWHDAGDYNKFPGYFLPHAFYGLVYAYEKRSHDFALYDKISLTGFQPNGVPDIIDEAMFGADFVVKMVNEEGNLYSGVRFNRSGSSFVPPEKDTDNKVGTSDDREIFDKEGGNGEAGIAAAALVKLYRILRDDPNLPRPKEEYLEKAELIWNHYWNLVWENQLFGDEASQILAALEFSRLFGKDTLYYNYLSSRTRQIADGFSSNPGASDDNAVFAGASTAVLLEAIEIFPELDPDGSVRQKILAEVDRIMGLASNPPGITQRVIEGNLVYFPPYHLASGGETLGMNAMYASVAWSAHLAYRATGDRRYLIFAQSQLDWILGANPARICMLEGAGTRNLRGYHTRLYKIPGHEDGAVPGAIPNGYVRSEDEPDLDEPWIDLRQNRDRMIFGYLANYHSNEPWIPNNGFYLMAIATQPH